MQIPLKRETATKIELALARFSRSWTGLDTSRRTTAIKTVLLSELLGGRGKASEIAGVADNTLDNYRHGKKDPKLRTLELMAEKAGIAARYLGGEWLFDGGNIRIELLAVADQQPPTAFAPGLMDRPSQPYLHGYDDVAPSQATTLLEGHWKKLGLEPTAITTVVAEGDSMEPTIAGDAPVFIDTRDCDLADGRIYAFRVDGRLIIRRVQRLAEGGFQLLADNSERYPPEKPGKRKSTKLEIVGRVRGSVLTC